MMDRVMDEVPSERLDGKVRAVTAAPGALPLAGSNVVEVRCDDVCSSGQLPGHDDRVLLAIAVLNSRGILIPVGEQRPVLGEHPGEPLLIQPQYITDMTAILKARPLRR